MFKDYYAILGIQFPSSQDEIKAAYRQQSLKWHPDKNPGKNTEEEMKSINETYSILKDAETKKRYDAEYVLSRKHSKATGSYEHSNTTEQKHQNRSQEEGSANGRTYNWEYDYDIKDEHLKDDIREARKAAEEYVKEFMESLRKDAKSAAKGAVEEAVPYIITGAVLSLFVLLIQTCS